MEEEFEIKIILCIVITQNGSQSLLRFHSLDLADCRLLNSSSIRTFAKYLQLVMLYDHSLHAFSTASLPGGGQTTEEPSDNGTNPTTDDFPVLTVALSIVGCVLIATSLVIIIVLHRKGMLCKTKTPTAGPLKLPDFALSSVNRKSLSGNECRYHNSVPCVSYISSVLLDENFR